MKKISKNNENECLEFVKVKHINNLPSLSKQTRCNQLNTYSQILFSPSFFEKCCLYSSLNPILYSLEPGHSLIMTLPSKPIRDNSFWHRREINLMITDCLSQVRTIFTEEIYNFQSKTNLLISMVWSLSFISIIKCSYIYTKKLYALNSKRG